MSIGSYISYGQLCHHHGMTQVEWPDWRFHDPFLGPINLLEQPRTQRNILLTWLPADTWIWLRNNQMQRCTGHGMEKVLELSCLLHIHPLSTSSSIHQPRSSLNPILLGFLEASLHRHVWLNHWSLVNDSTSSPPPLPEIRISGMKFQSSKLLVGSPGKPVPPSLGNASSTTSVT